MKCSYEILPVTSVSNSDKIRKRSSSDRVMPTDVRAERKSSMPRYPLFPESDFRKALLRFFHSLTS